jgi:hypothetical protein
LVEAITVRVRRAGVLLPPLTFLTVELDGERLSFTGFRGALRSRGGFATGRYAFRAQSPRARVRGTFTCPRERLVEAEYSDPGGAPRFCANTEIGDLEMTVERRVEGGAWESRRLTAQGTAHFETGGPAPGAVAAKHVTL